MPRVVSSPLEAARRLLATDKAWLLFLEVELRTRSPLGEPRYWRLVRDTKHRTAGGKVWQRCTIDIDFPPEDAQGNLGELTFALPNVSQVPLAYVLVDRDVVGCFVTARLAHESSLAVFEQSLTWRHRIKAMSGADEDAIRFNCGHPAQIGKGPGPIFDRRRFRLLPRTGGVR